MFFILTYVFKEHSPSISGNSWFNKEVCFCFALWFWYPYFMNLYLQMNYNTKTDTVIILSCSVTDICLSWSSLQTCMGIADLLVVWFLGGLLFRYLSYVDSIQQMWGHSWFGKMLCFWWSLSFWHLYHMVLTPRICSQSLLYTHDFMSWFLILISMFIDPSFGIVL